MIKIIHLYKSETFYFLTITLFYTVNNEMMDIFV